ncbi:MAG: toprim domain-containing protein [Saprospiraceae bacterium]
MLRTHQKIVYQNEEFNSATRSEHRGLLDDLRYNRVVIATDADVDGMHIRLLMLTFFLQFFPGSGEKTGIYTSWIRHFFRVRDKQQTFYCYSEAEKQGAIQKSFAANRNHPL